MRSFQIFYFIALFLLFSSENAAQQATNSRMAVIDGTVFDTNGAVIVGAEVKFTSSDGELFLTRTSDSGTYKIKLPESKYSIKISYRGFDDFNLNNYRVVAAYDLKKKMTFDVVLEVHVPSDIIEVQKRNNK